ncbi:MAG: hypothetical protein GX136_09000 [Clostridiales bacterium]|nr:hypothetical protein [Clostridiales bacterium]
MDKIKIPLYVVIMLCYVIGASFFSALSLIGFLLTVYLILRGQKQQVVEIMLLLSSFAGIMKLSDTFTLYNLLFVVAIIRMLWIDKGKVICFFVFFSLAIASVSTLGLYFAEPDTAFKLFSFVVGILFAGLVVSNTREYDIRALMRIFAFGIIASSLVFLMRDYLPGISRYITYHTFRVSAGVRQVRFSGLINNPNHYTLPVNLTCMALISYLISKKMRIIDVVLLGMLLLFGTYSLSKSFVFGLLVSAMISCVYLLKRNPGRWLRLLGVGLVVGLIVLQFVDTEYLIILIDRVLVEDAVDINSYSTGRFALFELYFNYMFENIRVLFLGNGLFNPLDRASHNLFIETVYSFGLIGTSLVTATYLKLSSTGLCIRRLKKRTILNYSLLLVFFVRGMAINIITSIMFPAYLIVITLFIGEELSDLPSEI